MSVRVSLYWASTNLNKNVRADPNVSFLRGMQLFCTVRRRKVGGELGKKDIFLCSRFLMVLYVLLSIFYFTGLLLHYIISL